MPPSTATVTLVERLKDIRFRTTQVRGRAYVVCLAHAMHGGADDCSHHGCICPSACVQDAALLNMERLYEWFLASESEALASTTLTALRGRHRVEVEAVVRGNYVIIRGCINNARAHPLRRLGVSSREVAGGYEVVGLVIHAKELGMDLR